ncbi:hypothetical protein BG61_11500 [Caballeronia glathei]|uniref:Uncharacterized protein n=1 Tax=Caballeronia glathei TaxID=60547 RepID=A0A069PCS3_9BURK|nr:hypothetical protein BG61_11500 [Caballeronia glathei]
MRHVDAQSVVLTRMAETRAEFLATSKELAPTRAPRVSRVAADVGPWLLRTPNAALFAALLVGLVVLGPKPAIRTALQAGLSTWTTRTVAALADSIQYR